MQIAEFKGNVMNPDVQKDVNDFLKKMDSASIISIQYNTNVIQVRKKDSDSPSIVTLSSVLIAYEEE